VQRPRSSRPFAWPIDLTYPSAGSRLAAPDRWRWTAPKQARRSRLLRHTPRLQLGLRRSLEPPVPARRLRRRGLEVHLQSDWRRAVGDGSGRSAEGRGASELGWPDNALLLRLRAAKRPARGSAVEANRGRRAGAVRLHRHERLQPSDSGYVAPAVRRSRRSRDDRAARQVGLGWPSPHASWRSARQFDGLTGPLVCSQLLPAAVRLSPSMKPMDLRRSCTCGGICRDLS